MPCAHAKGKLNSMIFDFEKKKIIQFFGVKKSINSDSNQQKKFKTTSKLLFSLLVCRLVYMKHVDIKESLLSCTGDKFLKFQTCHTDLTSSPSSTVCQVVVHIFLPTAYSSMKF